MSRNVFANGNEIASKKGDGKVVASFPDVCLSPPPPPTGPVPIPYPDSSFSKDLKKGTKNVKIGGGPVALSGQSYYKSSPLGNEAATRNFGANQLSHQITGKTQFGASSMNVSFEGKKVCRHIDITTSNHGSHPAGVSVPNPNLEAMFIASYQALTGNCECCGGPVHSTGRPMTMADWYGMNDTDTNGHLTSDAMSRRATYENLVRQKDAQGCSCRVLPEEPCNVHYETTAAERNKIIDDYDELKRVRRYREQILNVPSISTVHAEAIARGLTPRSVPFRRYEQARRQVNHLTPKAAGGCPIGDGNLSPNASLCTVCLQIEAQFTVWQGMRPLSP